MSAEPTASVTPFARTRAVLVRLLGPWVWCLAALGVLLIAAPHGEYHAPEAPRAAGMPAGGVAHQPEGQSRASYLADAARRLPPRLSARVGDPLWAADPFYPDLPRIWPWHPRTLTLWSRDNADLVVDDVDEPAVKPWQEVFPDLQADRIAKEFESWGVASFHGPNFQTVEDHAAISAGPWRWPQRTVSVSLWWLAGLPLLGSLWRLRGSRPAPPAEAARGRASALAAALRPWAAVAAVVAVAALTIGSRWWIPDSDADLRFEVRRDSFHPLHPRFLRVTLDRPETPELRAWAWGMRRWGARISNVRHEVPHAAGASRDRARRVDPDMPRSGRTLTAVDLSLWYLFLPAAVCSGVSLWWSRGGRMRPA